MFHANQIERITKKIYICTEYFISIFIIKLPLSSFVLCEEKQDCAFAGSIAGHDLDPDPGRW